MLLTAAAAAAAAGVLPLLCCMLPGHEASGSRTSPWFMASCSCVQDDERSSSGAGCGCTVSMGPGASDGGAAGLAKAKEPRPKLAGCGKFSWSLPCAGSCCLRRSTTSAFAKGLSGGDRRPLAEALRLLGSESSQGWLPLLADRGEPPGDCIQV